MKVGTPVSTRIDEIYDLFSPVEGLNAVYFGRVRNGKTYAATADILELLKRGEIVYANWKIRFSDFDERTSFKIALVKFFAGKKYFFTYSHENFHYIDTNSPDLVEMLNKLVGVHVFIDEGQWIFNSHLKHDDPEKRRLILEGGHYCRSLNVITQRPMNIMKDIRSQINIWYKCEKRLSLFGFILFARYSIEDMSNDEPIEPFSNEGRLIVPVKHYFASSEVFAAYETHAMRRADAMYLEPKFDVVETDYWDRLILVYSFFLPTFVKNGAAKIWQHRFAGFNEIILYFKGKLGLDNRYIIPKTSTLAENASKNYNLKDLKK